MPSAGVAAMKRWVALRTVRVGVGKGGEWNVIELVMQNISIHTVDGRNPAPVHRWFIPLFIGFQLSKVVQDIFHPQYVYIMLLYIYIMFTILSYIYTYYIILYTYIYIRTINKIYT